jgi:hypothetical protein
VISSSKENKMYKTRKALTSLQYSPKGQGIAGIPSKNFRFKIKISIFVRENVFEKTKILLKGRENKRATKESARED